MNKAFSADDQLAIMDVLIRYASGVDRRDWALFRTCFTDDFKADYGPFGHWANGDDITQAMEASHAPVGPTLHRMSNFAIRPSARGATVRSYVDAVLMPQEPGDAVSQATGFYDDILVRAGNGWKIADRKFTLVRFRQAIDPPSPF